MSNWTHTTILHEPRKLLRITVLEYTVLDIVYHSQTSPIYSIHGWSKNGCHQLGEFVGCSSGTIKALFDRMETMGYLEFTADRKMKRTTESFYGVAYEKDKNVLREIPGCSKTERVQKLNANRSKTEQRSVQKLNANRSKTEHKRELKENFNLIEKEIVETSSTPILDVDEIEDIEQQIYASKATQKPKEKVAPKRKGAASAEDMDLVYQVVTYLNEKTEQAFQPGGEKTKSLILARHHADKWNLEDFKTVIDHKKSEWFVKDNLRQYLRPSTLFAAGHAEEYLQAAKLWKKKPVATSPGVVPLFRQENFVNADRSKFKF